MKRIVLLLFPVLLMFNCTNINIEKGVSSLHSFTKGKISTSLVSHVLAGESSKCLTITIRESYLFDKVELKDAKIRSSNAAFIFFSGFDKNEIDVDTIVIKAINDDEVIESKFPRDVIVRYTETILLIERFKDLFNSGEIGQIESLLHESTKEQIIKGFAEKFTLIKSELGEIEQIESLGFEYSDKFLRAYVKLKCKNRLISATFDTLEDAIYSFEL